MKKKFYNNNLNFFLILRKKYFTTFEELINEDTLFIKINKSYSDKDIVDISVKVFDYLEISEVIYKN